MTQRPLVLVVDDDADLRMAIVSVLESAGKTALEAGDGVHALELLRSNEPELIVLDLAMPRMDGRTFLQRKAKSPQAAIPVVVFSSSPGDDLKAISDVAAVVDKLDGFKDLMEAIEDASREPPCAVAHPGDAVGESGAARGATDESLQSERDKTDDELARKRAADEDKADAVVELARRTADKVLQTTRETADESRTPSTAAGMTRERRREDVLVEAERGEADAGLRLEREESKQAAENPLQSERDETDEHLLTERGHAAETLATRDTFLAMVSHDLRTLLGGIAMATEMLTKTMPGEPELPPSARKRAMTIQRFTTRMNRLVGDLIDVASIDSGKLAFEPRREDLAGLVRESVELFLSSAREHGLSIRVESGALAVMAAFDRERILQVLGNLIGNAIKFTAKGGRVRLAVRSSPGEVQVSVSDNGRGIPSESLENIFGRFCQVGLRNRTGLGLGLFISRNIIEAHGGKIWAERIVTGGSRFLFTLPSEIASAAAA